MAEEAPTSTRVCPRQEGSGWQSGFHLRGSPAEIPPLAVTEAKTMSVWELRSSDHNDLRPIKTQRLWMSMLHVNQIQDFMGKEVGRLTEGQAGASAPDPPPLMSRALKKTLVSWFSLELFNGGSITIRNMTWNLWFLTLLAQLSTRHPAAYQIPTCSEDKSSEVNPKLMLFWVLVCSFWSADLGISTSLSLLV